MPTRFNIFTQFNAQAVSGTTTYNSPVANVAFQHDMGIDIRFTGSMTGTLTVNGSNDGLVFSSLTFNPALAQPAGSNLNYLINLEHFGFQYLQVSYVNSSGSGTLTSILTSKDYG